MIEIKIEERLKNVSKLVGIHLQPCKVIGNAMFEMLKAYEKSNKELIKKICNSDGKK